MKHLIRPHTSAGIGVDFDKEGDYTSYSKTGARMSDHLLTM